MRRPRANFYRIDHIEYAEKPGMDPDVVFIAVYLVGVLLTLGFVVWSLAS